MNLKNHQKLEGIPMKNPNKFVFEIIGFENPELFEKLKMAVKRQGGSISSFQQAEVSAPMTGDHLVRAIVVALAPGKSGKMNLQHAIEDISADLMVYARAA